MPRSAIDHWQHLGSSLRQMAEVLRSWMGRQEWWCVWRPLDEACGKRCYSATSTVQGSDLRCSLDQVQQLCCVWHLWRNLGSDLANAAGQAAAGWSGEAVRQDRQPVQNELGRLIHKVLDARSCEQAETALVTLQGHPPGVALGKRLNGWLTT